MESLSNDFFLLMAHLSQLNDLQNSIKVFVGGLNNILSPVKFTWTNTVPDKESDFVEINNSRNTLGYISCSEKIDKNKYAHFQNAIQVFCAYAERIQQHELLENREEELEAIIKQNTQDLLVKNEKLQSSNEEYESLHEEHKALNDELKGKNEELNYTVKKLFRQNHQIILNEEISNATGIIAKVGGWEYDFKSKKVKWTAAIRTIFETDTKFNPSLEESLSFFTGEDNKRIKTYLNNAIVTGVEFNEEFQATTIQNNKIWVRAAGYPEIELGKCVSFLGIFQDITEQKEAEQKITDALERFSKAEEIANMGSWNWDPITNKVGWSDNMCRLYGIEPSEFDPTFDYAKQYTHPDDLVFVNKMVERFLIEKKAQPISEYRIITAENKIVWIEASSEVELDEKGEISEVVGTAQDITERKQAEEQLKESEEKFRALYDNAPLSYQSLNEDGSFIDINPTWLSTLGYERNEIIGKFYKDFLHPDWQPHFEDNFPKFKRRGYVNDVQFKIRHKAGHYLDISFEGCIGYNPDGSFKQTYCVFQDITEKMKAELALKESEERFRHMFSNHDAVMLLIDSESGKIIDANLSAQNFYGKTEEDLKLTTIQDINSLPEDEVLELSKQVQKEQQNYFLFPHRVANGEIRTVEVYSSPIIINKRQILFSIIHDVTERILAEQALQESTVFNETLLNTSPDIIYIYDILENKNVYSNDRIMKVLGYSIEEIQAMGSQIISKLMHPADFNKYLEEIYPRYQQVKDNELITHEYRMKHKNGDWYWLLSKESIFMRDGLNKPVQIFGIMSDITDRKHAEEELKKHHALLEDLVKERTADLEIKNQELDRSLKVFIGREMTIKKLQKKIQELEGK